jgi:hypothetical protein
MQGICLYAKIMSSPFERLCCICHPGQVPRHFRRSFNEDGTGTRAGIQNDLIFLDSPSTSLRVVSLSNHGVSPSTDGLARNDGFVELRHSVLREVNLGC